MSETVRIITILTKNCPNNYILFFSVSRRIVINIVNFPMLQKPANKFFTLPVLVYPHNLEHQNLKRKTSTSKQNEKLTHLQTMNHIISAKCAMIHCNNNVWTTNRRIVKPFDKGPLVGVFHYCKQHSCKATNCRNPSHRRHCFIYQHTNDNSRKKRESTPNSRLRRIYYKVYMRTRNKIRRKTINHLEKVASQWIRKTLLPPSNQLY